MFLLLADDIAFLVDSIFYWILVGTIVLGSIFALIGLIMAIKKIRYDCQMNHNKKEVEKYRKRLIGSKEEQGLYDKMKQ